MYAQQSLHDGLFLMFYGAVAMLAVVAGLYLWLRRSNGILPDIQHMGTSVAARVRNEEHKN